MFEITVYSKRIAGLPLNRAASAWAGPLEPVDQIGRQASRRQRVAAGTLADQINDQVRLRATRRSVRPASRGRNGRRSAAPCSPAGPAGRPAEREAGRAHSVRRPPHSGRRRPRSAPAALPRRAAPGSGGDRRAPASGELRCASLSPASVSSTRNGAIFCSSSRRSSA